MGAALAHLLHHDAQNLSRVGHRLSPDLGPAVSQTGDHAGHADQSTTILRKHQLAEASAARLLAAGRKVSRRTLRADGVRGSNADLGALARAIRSEPTAGRVMPDSA
jgi:hypothetical protein